MTPLLEALTAALADRYRIGREIGAGGMATVYLAEDLRHHRKVAIKVLRPELAAVVGAERFLSEIRTTANLQHPHLLPLFDSGEAQGQLFYVMPYVAGESLRARLERERQLPVDEAIRIAVAVAGALEHAHRHGVIHRDLKPENILLHEGQPLVADFGIALAVGNAGGERVTLTGISLGTPAYMSPEQATGERSVDGRSDLYSLAAITYEMLVGAPPHAAPTTQAIIAKLLTERAPRVRAQRESVPIHVDSAIAAGLAKLPADRFQNAGDFAAALAGARPVPRGGADAENEPATRLRRTPILAASAAGLLGLLLGGLFLDPSPADTRGVSTLAELTLPDTIQLFSAGVQPAVSLSPDGTTLAFVGSTPSGSAIFVRRMDDLEIRRVTELSFNNGPVFSPDGSAILFDGSGVGLSIVPVSGGPSRTIALERAAADLFGMSWSDRDEILFEDEGSIWKVPAAGGALTVVARFDTLRGHYGYSWPHALPGGEAALITIQRGTGLASAELGVVRIPSGEVTELGVVGTNPRYLSSGHVVFGQVDGAVLALPFSLRRLRATGAPFRVLTGVGVTKPGGLHLALSENGTALYRLAESGDRQLLAVDRSGRSRPLGSDRQPFLYPRVSPDGRRIAVTRGGPPFDIWVQDLASGTLSRVTTNGTSERPEWTPDGARIAYYNDPVSGGRVGETRPWDGSGRVDTLLDASVGAAEITMGGDRLAVRGVAGIWVGPLAAPDEGGSIGELARFPRLSPDGELLALVRTITGRDEIYVSPMPDAEPWLQVSVEGGTEPVWSADGSQLFYRGIEHPYFMAVTIAREPELAVTRRETLFADTFAVGLNPRANYDVLPGSGEFVVVKGDSRPPPVYLMTNWEAAMARAQEAEARD